MSEQKLQIASQKLNLLERREIEASIVGPLVRAMEERFGEGPAREVLAEVIQSLARESGAELAKTMGDRSLRAFSTNLGSWKSGGALNLEMIEESDERLSFNVTRCQYAEMYRRLGLNDLGATLSCVRDFELATGFNPLIRLKRTQTLMEGASHCDFRFEMISEPERTDASEA
ncbi:MAG: L-2-amino-thiazoline-4-carboxylic acid hydrolase [Planctomycetota bacterium]